MVPRNGLYHVLVNLNIWQYWDNKLKFSIMINNQTEAFYKTVTLGSRSMNTITLDRMLRLKQNQTILVVVSSPSRAYRNFFLRSTSSYFIFSKGMLTDSIPAISASYTSSTNVLSVDLFSVINHWDITSKPKFSHYSNVQLQNGEFVSPKSRGYQVFIALYVSNCTEASARLSLKSYSDWNYKAISPDISFHKENKACRLENSMVLSMNVNDTLKVEVKSDIKYTVLTKTTYQVVFQTHSSLWPASIYKLANSFQFRTNSAPVTVSQ